MITNVMTSRTHIYKQYYNVQTKLRLCIRIIQQINLNATHMCQNSKRMYKKTDHCFVPFHSLISDGHSGDGWIEYG